MTTESMPAFIAEANELYLTDPAGAVVLLYEGTRKLRQKVATKRQPSSKSERDKQLSILESAHGLMEEILEDAQEGILPDQLEWELDMGVAVDIVRITRKYGS
ncbi:MAG: hypothetical protein OXE17_07570 [Chloroflexi bacterium]|nr:hypothetical protein [Chloroflexota bacterium]